ncbi:hypothetical protein HPB49_014413 [Dermacentor silvarum]|uniref:Uncharacterized protein n=1 Tax=Dermacentor silvarum TaxID=543639 RepID=A0ACB8E0E1_DERSI|nr:hypothetical protein HPB49_014413 [Dermacentor silvarum]
MTYIPRCREDIVSVINRNRVVVICGETGSGKTKQAAQFIFEDYIRGGQGSRCNIVVTQPRRIAATSMAKRAALQRHKELSHTAGFQVRLTKQLLTSRGGILFCTVGILVRHWQQNGELVDEVHERDVSTDFLLVAPAHSSRQYCGVRTERRTMTTGCSRRLLQRRTFACPSLRSTLARLLRQNSSGICMGPYYHLA